MLCTCRTVHAHPTLVRAVEQTSVIADKTVCVLCTRCLSIRHTVGRGSKSKSLLTANVFQPAYAIGDENSLVRYCYALTRCGTSPTWPDVCHFRWHPVTKHPWIPVLREKVIKVLLVLIFSHRALIGHVTLVAITSQSPWFPVFKSSHCNSFGDRVPAHCITWWLIVKWISLVF